MVRSGAGVACGGHRKKEEKLKELGQSAPVEARKIKRKAADAKNSDGVKGTGPVGPTLMLLKQRQSHS